MKLTEKLGIDITLEQATEHLFNELKKEPNLSDAKAFVDEFIVLSDKPVYKINKPNHKDWCWSTVLNAFQYVLCHFRLASHKRRTKLEESYLNNAKIIIKKLYSKNPELYNLLYDYVKIYDVYMASKNVPDYGEITYNILKESLYREENNISNNFTDLQKFIYNLHFMLPDAYIPRINRGYYCDWFNKQEYLDKRNQNYILNEKGHKRLLELQAKFEKQSI